MQYRVTSLVLAHLALGLIVFRNGNVESIYLGRTAGTTLCLSAIFLAQIYSAQWALRGAPQVPCLSLSDYPKVVKRRCLTTTLNALIRLWAQRLPS